MSFRLFTESVGDSIVPKKLRKGFYSYLQKAGYKKTPYFGLGILTYILVLISLGLIILLLQLQIFSNIPYVAQIPVALLLLPFVSTILIYIALLLFRLYLDAKIYFKIQKMEAMFPEFLSVLSLNLKSGQSLETALKNSLEDDFGVLKDEMENVVKKIHLGDEVDDALTVFTQDFKSDLMQETFELILLSWKKGAKTPPLIDRMVESIEQTRFLQHKVVASVTNYKIFLSAVTLIITPAMFALSYQLVNLIRSMVNKILVVSSNTIVNFPITAVRFNDQHFIIFSVIAVFLISTFSAMIISVIKTGRIKESYKDIIFFSSLALLSYYLFTLVFEKFFSWFLIT